MKHFILSRSKRSLGTSGILICLALLLGGCNKPATGEQKREPPKVTVALPVVKDVPDEAYFTGVVQPSDRVDIRARVEGVLQDVYFKDGDVVTKNDKLFLIEQAPYTAQWAAAKAQKLETIVARDLAKATLDRYQKLYDKNDGTVTEEELQAKQADYDAQAAKLQADDAAIELAKIQWGYTAIRAPITGLMSEKFVDLGNLVGAGENTKLATIVQMHPMNVYFDVSEDVVLKYLERRRKNAGPSPKPVPCYVGLKNEEGYPHKGELDYIDFQIDLSTGSALVRGEFPNQEGYFYSGEFARVKVALDPIKDAITVEEEALGSDLDGKYLLVVGTNDIVEQRRVETGPLSDGMRVIRKAKFEKVIDEENVEQEKIVSGILPDERYIVVGLQKARPGLPVKPEMRPKSESGRKLTPDP